MFGEILEVVQRPQWSGAVYRHVELSGAALLFGIALSLAIAVAVSRSRAYSLLAINVMNLGRGVPDLAILALGLLLLGIGYLPAAVALTLISVPPVLINTITALNQVDPKVVDSARGMGLSERQILTGIRLPLGAPVIFAGIRTSAVQVVGSATLATFIGGGGLGDLIVEGFAGFRFSTMLAGAIPVALLAITADLLFGGLERISTPKGLRLAHKKR